MKQKATKSKFEALVALIFLTLLGLVGVDADAENRCEEVFRPNSQAAPAARASGPRQVTGPVSIEGHRRDLYRNSSSPDSRYFVSDTVLDTTTGRVVLDFQNWSSYTLAPMVEFGPGSVLAFAPVLHKAGEVVVMDMSSLKVKRIVQHSEDIGAIRFFGDLLVTVSKDGAGKLTQEPPVNSLMISGGTTFDFQVSESKSSARLRDSFDISADGKLLLIRDRGDLTATLFSIESGRPAQPIMQVTHDWKSLIQARFLPNSRRFLTQSSNGETKVTDPDKTDVNRGEIAKFGTGGEGVLSSDGTKFFAQQGFAQDVWNVFDVKSGEVIRQILMQSTPGIVEKTYSANSNGFVFGYVLDALGGSRGVELVNTISGDRTEVISHAQRVHIEVKKGRSGLVWTEFEPTKKNGELALVDLVTGRVVGKYLANREPVMSEDGSIFAFTYEDLYGLVYLHVYESTGRKIEMRPLGGASNSFHIALTANGKKLLLTRGREHEMFRIE